LTPLFTPSAPVRSRPQADAAKIEAAEKKLAEQEV